MSKKHFIQIAADIKRQIIAADNEATLLAIKSLASDLCDTFRACNANFDRQRFLAACGF